MHRIIFLEKIVRHSLVSTCSLVQVVSTLFLFCIFAYFVLVLLRITTNISSKQKNTHIFCNAAFLQNEVDDTFIYLVFKNIKISNRCACQQYILHVISRRFELFFVHTNSFARVLSLSFPHSLSLFYFFSWWILS